MSDSKCLICEQSMVQDIVVVKSRGIKSLLSVCESRGDTEKKTQLQALTEVTLHGACYKNYSNKRLAAVASRRSSNVESPSTSREVQRHPDFDFEKKCLFCGEEAKESSSKVPQKYRSRISLIQHASSKQEIVTKLGGRKDEIAVAIKNRMNRVTDLVAAKARYHRKCYKHVVREVTHVQTGRPFSNVIDEGMSQIYAYLEENSNECQFSLEFLLEQVKTDHIPHLKTIKARLLEKYGDDIIIVERQKRGTMICFRNIGYKLLEDNWYRKKRTDPTEEKLRVLREAAAILRRDIRSEVYETDTYPPSDDFVKDVKSAVPETLQVFLSEIILKDKRGLLIPWERKVISIAHAIIAAVRPRSFLSPLQIGVGAFLYKKFASKTLINILSKMGFSASYGEVLSFENSSIQGKKDNVLNNGFSQFFDELDDDMDDDSDDLLDTREANNGVFCEDDDYEHEPQAKRSRKI